MAKKKPAEKKSATKQSVESKSRVKKLTFFLKNNWLRVVVIALILVGLALFANEYLQTRQQLKDLQSPTSTGQTEIQTITDQVNKVAELPTGETPTLATVNDKTKLEAQAFFKNAQNGDKVLIYAQAKRAVLYRPSTNKVIEISTVNFTNNSATTQTPAAQ